MIPLRLQRASTSLNLLQLEYPNIWLKGNKVVNNIFRLAPSLTYFSAQPRRSAFQSEPRLTNIRLVCIWSQTIAEHFAICEQWSAIVCDYMEKTRTSIDREKQKTQMAVHTFLLQFRLPSLIFSHSPFKINSWDREKWHLFLQTKTTRCFPSKKPLCKFPKDFSDTYSSHTILEWHSWLVTHWFESLCMILVKPTI